MKQSFPEVLVFPGTTTRPGYGYKVDTCEFVPLTLLRNPDAPMIVDKNANTRTKGHVAKDRFDSIQDLEVSAEVTLSVMGGLFSLTGSGSYLGKKHKSSQTMSFNLVSETTSETHQLPFSQDGVETWDYELLKKLQADGDITHVVTKVQYGSKATLAVDYTRSEAEDEMQVHGFLSATCQKLAFSISGKGQVDVTEEEKKKQENFSYTLQADVLFDFGTPTTFEDAVQKFSAVTKELSNNQRVVKAWIVPIKYLLNSIDTLNYEIDKKAVDMAVKRMRELEIFHQRVNALFEAHAEVMKVFSFQFNQAKKLEELLTRETSDLQSKLRKTLAAVRKQGSANATEELYGVVAQNIHFQTAAMNRFIELKGKECTFLQKLLHEVRETFPTPFQSWSIPFHDKSILAFMIGYNLATSDHKFLDDNLRKQFSLKTKEWVENPAKCKALRQKVGAFKKLAMHNKKSEVVEYDCLMNDEHDEDGIFIFTGNEWEEFTLPGDPTLTLDTAKTTFEQLALIAPQKEDDFKDVDKFVVELQDVGVPSKTVTKHVCPGDSIVFDKVVAGRQYQAIASCITVAGETVPKNAGVFVVPMAPAPGNFVHLECTEAKVELHKLRSESWWQLPLVEARKPILETVCGIDCRVEFKRVHLNNVKQFHGADEVTILCVGSTGVGKSASMSAIANWILGVDETCTHRYLLMQSASAAALKTSVTKDITVYTIPCIQGGRVQLKVNLVDCPGYADTDGLHRDDACDNMMKMFFKAHEKVNLFMLVADHTEKMTGEMKYILGRMTGVFGKAMAKNFALMLTKDFGAAIPQGLVDDIQGFGIHLPEERQIKLNGAYAPLIDPGHNFIGKCNESIQKMMRIAESVKPVQTQQAANVVEHRQALKVSFAKTELALANQLDQLNKITVELNILKNSSPQAPKKQQVKETKKIFTGAFEFLGSGNYHGDPARGHSFWVYPQDKYPPNFKKWDVFDTMPTGDWCTNCSSVPLLQADLPWLKRFVCKGHPKLEEVTTKWVDHEGLMNEYADGVEKYKKKEHACKNMLEQYISCKGSVVEMLQQIKKTHTELQKIALNPSLKTPEEYIKMLQHQLAENSSDTGKAALLSHIIAQNNLVDKFVVNAGLEDLQKFDNHLKAGIAAIAHLLTLTPKSFSEEVNKVKSYSWCQHPCKWSVALDKLIELIGEQQSKLAMKQTSEPPTKKAKHK